MAQSISMHGKVPEEVTLRFDSVTGALISVNARYELIDGNGVVQEGYYARHTLAQADIEALTVSTELAATEDPATVTIDADGNTISTTVLLDASNTPLSVTDSVSDYAKVLGNILAAKASSDLGI